MKIKIVLLICITSLPLFAQDLSYIWTMDEYRAELIQQERDSIFVENLRVHNPEDSLKIDMFYYNSVNSELPVGYNDLSLWQGRGYNGLLIPSIQWNSANFSIKLAPEFSFSQNLPYDILESTNPDTEYGYYYYGDVGYTYIDAPQRFGDEPFFNYTDIGQSYISYDLNRWQFSVSNEAVKIGPAVYNPILMSFNAPGHPHFSIGYHNEEMKVGSLEFFQEWGWMTESEYFDENGDNNLTYFSLLSFSYTPQFIPQLSLGFSRCVLGNGEEFEAVWLAKLYEVPGLISLKSLGRDNLDQRFSAFLEWRLTEVGFRTYLDWSRNDYTSEIRNVLTLPGHSQAYTLGFEKSLGKENQWLGRFELTQLIWSRDYDISPLGYGSFYGHHFVTHGHTNNGQLLGASIGSGSNAQTFSLDYFHENYSLTSYIRRVSYNMDYVYAGLDSDPDDDQYQLMASISLGLLHKMDINQWTISSAYDFMYMFNNNYERENDLMNHHIGVSVNYAF